MSGQMQRSRGTISHLKFEISDLKSRIRDFNLEISDEAISQSGFVSRGFRGR
jgi:hypothetical protein